MSEQWMGLHHPDWHDSVGVRAWCRCGTWCSDGAACDCCELVELRAEVETLRAQVKAARDVMKCEEDCGATVEFVHVWSDPAMRTYACAAHRCSGCVLLDGAK